MYQSGGGGDLTDQHIVDSLGDSLVHSHAGRGIGLGIKVAEQYPFSVFGEGGGEVDTGGGLADSALLVDNGDNLCHGGTYFPNSGAVRLFVPAAN